MGLSSGLQDCGLMHRPSLMPCVMRTNGPAIRLDLPEPAREGNVGPLKTQ